MTLQLVRDYYEDHVRKVAAALTPPVPVFFDNQPFTDADAAIEHMLMRLDFGATTEEVIGDTVEFLRGSLVVEIYTPKGKGPGRGERIATEVMKSLFAINREPHKATNKVRGAIGPATGPTFFALEGRPHWLTRLGCGFHATYTG